MLDWGWWLGQGDLLVGWLVKLLSSSVWRNRKCTFYDIVACCFLMLHVSVCVSISPAFRLSLSKKWLVWYYLHWHVCEWELIFSVPFQPVILLIAILDLSVFSPAWQFTNPEAVQTFFFLLLFLHQPDSLPNQKLFKCLFFPFCFSTSLTVYQSRSCSNAIFFLLFLHQPDSLPIQKLFKPLDDNGEPQTLEHLLKYALSDYDWPGMFLNLPICLPLCLFVYRYMGW